MPANRARHDCHGRAARSPRRASKPSQDTGRLREHALHVAKSYRYRARAPAEVAGEEIERSDGSRLEGGPGHGFKQTAALIDQMFEAVRCQPQSGGFGGFSIPSRGTLQFVFENLIDILFDAGQVSLGAGLLDAFGQSVKPIKRTYFRMLLQPRAMNFQSPASSDVREPSSIDP